MLLGIVNEKAGDVRGQGGMFASDVALQMRIPLPCSPGAGCELTRHYLLWQDLAQNPKKCFQEQRGSICDKLRVSKWTVDTLSSTINLLFSHALHIDMTLSPPRRHRMWNFNEPLMLVGK